MARRRATKHHCYRCSIAFDTEQQLKTHKQQQHKIARRRRPEGGRVNKKTPQSPKHDDQKGRYRRSSLIKDESDYDGKSETIDQYLSRVANWGFEDDFESISEVQSQDSLKSEARSESSPKSELERLKLRRWYAEFGLGYKLGGRAITNIPLYQLSELGRCALGRHNRSK
jgi:hypothetical protein